MKISDDRDLGLCACGQRIYSCIIEGIPAVMHELPYCRKFADLEPDKFLTYVRRSRGIPDEALRAGDN